MGLRKAARRTAVRGILLALLAAFLGALPGGSAMAADGELVKVKEGTLRGKVVADGRQFLGVPYAAPPTGERRFRPPQPATPWPDVRDATKEGNICPQLGLGNEDCLVANVYTPPAAESKNLPVMVWIHGGAYILGWGSMYDPMAMVAQGKLIVVSVNYRVGPLGFMALPGLAEESGTTGNYALLDQQAGLRWVRDNIGAFGGDPRNVTIFGESAGGHSICMQLISPTAAGLFHKAISESGGCVDTALGPVTSAKATATSTEFAKSLGCTDPGTAIACLRGKPANVFSADLASAFGVGGLSWVPVIDGKVVKEPTRAALTSGRYNKVPLISGTNKHEGRLFLAFGYHLAKFRRANADELKAELELRAGTVTPELAAAYPAEAPDNADIALSSATTDGGFSCPALFTDRAAVSNAGQQVYAYEFADPEPPLSGLDPFLNMGDYHAAELMYLFFPGLLNDTQKKLSNQMIGYWTTFAKTGNPNGAGTPEWPAFTSGSQRMQRLTTEGTAPFGTFAADHKCHLWDRG